MANHDPNDRSSLQFSPVLAVLESSLGWDWNDPKEKSDAEALKRYLEKK